MRDKQQINTGEGMEGGGKEGERGVEEEGRKGMKRGMGYIKIKERGGKKGRKGSMVRRKTRMRNRKEWERREGENITGKH